MLSATALKLAAVRSEGARVAGITTVSALPRAFSRAHSVVLSSKMHSAGSHSTDPLRRRAVSAMPCAVLDETGANVRREELKSRSDSLYMVFKQQTYMRITGLAT
eukprot:6027267-Pleurochrysis_carterae.AAC.1